MQTEEPINEEKIEQEVLENLGSLIIYQRIREAQQNYGLQHGDYSRYQKYSSNKVHKLRLQMKFTYGKRFQRKLIQKEVKNDPRVLQVLLFEAEKNWAHAMALKQFINTTGVSKKVNKKRTKVYLVKKIKKAVLYANQLQEVCEARTEKRTALEAEAYVSYLKGLHYFETEKWERAIDFFVKCYNIYEQILKVCDQFSQGLYQERLDGLNQQIRYCNARAKRAATLSFNDLLKMQQSSKDPTLNAKLEEMLEEQRNAKIQQAQGQFEVEYQDAKYPIKNEKVIKLIQKIRETKLSQDLESFTVLFSYYEEALKLVKADKDASTSEGEREIHIKIAQYLNFQRQTSVLDRNEILMQFYTHKFIQEDGMNNLQNMQTRKAQKLKLTTPQEIIRYCDNFTQTLRLIMDEERFSKDITLFKILDAKEFFAKAVRCFFVGCLYFTNEKYKEAYSLLGYSGDLVKIAVRKYQENKLPENRLLADVVPLIQQVWTKSKLFGLKAQQEQVKAVGQELHQITLDEEKKKLTLMELTSQPELVSLENVLTFKPLDLAQLLEPIPPKPIFLDIALTYLKYPKLEEPKKQGGFWGKLNIFKKQ